VSAELIYLRTEIHQPARRICWKCLFVWTAPAVFWVLVFAWVLA